MFAASRFGQTNRFAEPCSVLSGRMVLRRPSSKALSPCISPSTSSSGALSRSCASACRIFSADGASELPKLECDSSASLSSTPHRVRGHRGDLGDLLGGGIEIDVGVDQKHLTV